MTTNSTRLTGPDTTESSIPHPLPRAGARGPGGTPAPAPAADAGCSLADLAPGARAEVVDVVGGGPTAVRLTELGVTPGTVVEVVRRAPLRDPVIYRLKDYELCLRRAQAACVRTAVVA
jgi:ferrous iron transport protein A